MSRTKIYAKSSNVKKIEKIEKRKRKRKDSMKSIKEIKKYQISTKNLIHKSTFKRLVKGILNDLTNNFQIEAKAVDVLQESCEDYIVHMFQDMNDSALHRKCVTVNMDDFKLFKKRQR